MSSNEDARSVARPSLARPISYQNTVEGSKSRLVQPRYSTRSSMHVSTNIQAIETDQPRSPTKEPQGSSETTKPVTGINTDGTVVPTRLRPRSMYQAGSAASQRAEQSAKSIQQSMRPPAPVSKLPEPQTNRLVRTQSLRNPGVTSQSTRQAGTTSHSRIQSVNAATTRRDAAKSGITLERSRSLVGAPNGNFRTSGPSADTVPVDVPSRLAGHRRSASTKTRLEPSASALETKSLSRPEEPLVTHSARRDGVPEGTKKTTRPAFTTLQQHFTPRKTGKAATATFLHPAPVTGPQGLPPEVMNLQTELLQLHLLHQSSAEVCRQWEQSAKRNLRAKFEEVASLHQTLLEHERASQEQKNLQSLLEWSAGKSSAGLVEHIQILSEPLHELPSLVEPGGRLQRCIGEFEHWVSWVQQVRSARQSSTADAAGSHTIEGLGDSWRAEVAALVRKLTAFTRALDSLADPSPGSSLLCIVDACKSLLGGLLEELQIMQMIEAEMVAKEKSWVEDQLKSIAKAIGTGSVGGGGDIAAWRS